MQSSLVVALAFVTSNLALAEGARAAPAAREDLGALAQAAEIPEAEAQVEEGVVPVDPGEPPPGLDNETKPAVAQPTHADPRRPGTYKVGVGLRTTFATGREGHGIDSINVQPRFAGRVHEIAGFEATLEFGRDYVVRFPIPPFQPDVDIVPLETNNVVDVIGKLEPSPYFNLWFGRLTPPSDRQNMAGPYLQTTWNAPRTIYRYPSTFAGTRREDSFFSWGRTMAGRDEGAVIWGQVDGGKLKYYVGALNLHVQPTERVRFAGRVTLNLWDPEPGYYSQSTYFGERNILAIGVAAQYQQYMSLGFRAPLIPTDPTTNQPALPTTAEAVAATPLTDQQTPSKDLLVANVDFLMERRLGGAGTLTLEGGFYRGMEPLPNYVGPFPDLKVPAVARNVNSWFGLVGYLFPGSLGWGRIQPTFRWQQQMFDISRDTTDFVTGRTYLAVKNVWTMDVFINYIISGHDLRLTLGYQHTRINADERPQFVNIGLQMQI
jgi:hypothetical protein